MNEISKWLDGVRGTDSIREVARKIGSTHATLNRQVNDDSLSFELVRAIAYTYGRPVLADLVATGHLSLDDIGASDLENAITAASDEQLLVEIARRLEVPGANALFDRPISEAVEEATNITHLHDVRAPKQNHKEVANDSINEFPEGDDADHDGGA